MNRKINLGSILCFGISIGTLLVGLFKLLVYRKPEVFKLGINAYTGNRGEDLKININFAIAMFILTLIFVVLGIYFDKEK